MNEFFMSSQPIPFVYYYVLLTTTNVQCAETTTADFSPVIAFNTRSRAYRSSCTYIPHSSDKRFLLC